MSWRILIDRDDGRVRVAAPATVLAGARPTSATDVVTNQATVAVERAMTSGLRIPCLVPVAPRWAWRAGMYLRGIGVRD